MKFLILGGGGFLGSSLVDSLLQNGHDVLVFEHIDVEPYRKFNSNESCLWIKGDFTKKLELEKCLSGVDCVVHLISTTIPSTSNLDPFFDVESNLFSTLMLLDLMRKYAVKKLIYISSGGTVYGNPLYLPIDEMHPTNPNVSYGITKLTIEKYILLYKKLYSITPVILRLSNPYGVRQRSVSQGVVGVFLRKILNGDPVTILGDGNVTRDYIYISDVVDAIHASIHYDGSYDVFNIGSGIETSINELLFLMKSIFEKSFEIIYTKPRAFDNSRNCLDISLATRELGWKPRVSLSDGLLLTKNWLLKNNIKAQNK